MGAAGLSLLALAALPQAGHAQAGPVAPPSRGELLPPEVRDDPARTRTLTIDGGLERSPCALDNPAMADIKVTLSQVEFVGGGEAIAGMDLASTYQPYLGRELPLSVLCDIRARAATMLTDAGYLAAVEIPAQRLEGGSAQFRVILGRLTALRVRGDAGPSQKVLEGYLQHLVGQPVFNVNDAERYLLLADDIPGMDVRLALRPAANGEPGDLIGEVAVVRRAATVSLNVQNYGSRALGRFGGLLGVQLYDLTGLGDVTTVSAFSSYDFAEQQTLQVGHDFLVGNDGLRLGGQVTLGWTNPSINLPGFTVKADTVFTTLRASYPLLRTQATSLSLSGGLDLVNQDVRVNTVRLSRDQVRTGWTRLDLTATDSDSIARRGGYTPYEPRQRLSAGIELRQGLSILGANADCRGAPLACLASNKVPSRIEQDPTALLMRLELQGEFRPVPQFAIVTRAQAQFTRDALPAFEEISAGNYSIGRGHDPGALTGDRGVAMAVEFRLGSLMPQDLDGVATQPYVFVDAARFSDRDPSRRAFGSDRIASVGGGTRFAWARGMQGDVSLAVPLRNSDARRRAGLPREDVRFLVSITSRLFPWSF